MPPHRKIKLLSNLVGDWVWKWLLKCSLKNDTPQVRKLQKTYISMMLNSNIRQALLNKILSIDMYKLDASGKCTLIELLGDKTITCIDFSKSGFMYIEEVFHLFRTLTMVLLINLIKLGFDCKLKALRDEKFVGDVNLVFHRVLNQMYNLKWVAIRGVAEMDTLLIIGQNCKMLEHLDISNSKQVTDEGIIGLLLKKSEIESQQNDTQEFKYGCKQTNSCCNYLTFIGLTGTQVTDFGLVCSLIYVPNIKSFGGYLTDASIVKAISIMEESVQINGVCLKLVDMCEYVLLEKDICCIGKYLPHLKSMTTAAKSLKALSKYENLENISVECDFSDIEGVLLDYLQYQGSSLRELVLLDSINCTVDISSIAQMAPNLIKLVAPLFIFDDSSVVEMHSLEHAQVSCCTSLCLKTFLHSCPNLKHLELKFEAKPYSETFNCINDDLILDVLCNGGLKKVEHLHIEECGISENGLDNILLYCSSLSHLSKLYNWPQLSINYVEELRKRIIRYNWDLSVIYYSEFE